MTPDNSFTLFSIKSKKNNQDHVTSYKISLLVLIKEFCTIKIRLRNICEAPSIEWEFTSRQKRDFSIIILKLIQRLDIEIIELIKQVKPILHPNLFSIFIEKLKNLHEEGISGLMDYIQSLDSLLVDPYSSSPVIYKSSVLGLFVRRMLLAFDKLTFDQVIGLHKNFVKFCKPLFKSGEDESCLDTSVSMTISPQESLSESLEFDCDTPAVVSQKQAEFFIAQQVSLLQINESEALPAPELHKKLSHLLKGNPELSEAYYLQYVNCLRAREFCGSVNTLLHYFDMDTSGSKPSLPPQQPGSQESDNARGFRYAALNMAILQAHFGHKEEALLSLREAIKLAQDSNDNACLQHALTRLYQLTDDNSGPLIERSVAKSSELSMWYLASLNLLSLAQYQALSKVPPAQVFEVVMKSDVYNCQHSMTEMMGTAHAQKASLWALYGNRALSNLSHQCLLNLNVWLDNRGGTGATCHRPQSLMLALYRLIWDLAGSGEMGNAQSVLIYAKQAFPQQASLSLDAPSWHLCELQLQFQHYLNHAYWEEARQAAEAIAPLNAFDSLYRKVELCIYQGHHNQANAYAEKLLELAKDNPLLHIQATLLECRRAWQVGYPKHTLGLLQSCLNTCKEHHFFFLEALTKLHFATGLYYHKHHELALPILDKIMVALHIHGTLTHIGIAYFLYARCLMSCLGPKVTDSDVTHITLVTISKLLEKAHTAFEQVQDQVRQRSVLIWLANMNNILNNTQERNHWACKVKTLNHHWEGRIALNSLPHLVY